MMPKLIPSQEDVMEILKKTGAFREGHFVYPSGRHTPHYFQMPLAFRFYDTARVLAVALSRKFRTQKEVSSALPKVAIISPGPGGIPVAFGVRDALSAEQIYWAEREEGKRMFRQYVNKGEVNPCVIVDDISRTGDAIEETVEQVRQLGAKVIHRLARRVRRQVVRRRQGLRRVPGPGRGRARALLRQWERRPRG
jgi:orotate phosphoribosyltransferase